MAIENFFYFSYVRGKKIRERSPKKFSGTGIVHQILFPVTNLRIKIKFGIVKAKNFFFYNFIETFSNSNGEYYRRPGEIFFMMKMLGHLIFIENKIKI